MLRECSCALLCALHAGAVKPDSHVVQVAKAGATWTDTVPRLVPQLQNRLGANACFANACAQALWSSPTFRVAFNDTLAFAQVILLLVKHCRAVRSL